MKKIIILFVLLTSMSFAQTTFNGRSVQWGWSGEDYSKEAVIAILEENGPDVDKFTLQAKVDKVTNAEFLWKINQNQVAKADKTASSYIVGGVKVSSVLITLESDGKGEIRLYSKDDTLVGRVRCRTTSKRIGVKYTQLAPGDYKVIEIDPDGWSNELKCKMPNEISLDGVAKTRGVKIHSGNISPKKPKINVFHGCIRVSEPVGQQFMEIISIGTFVKVIWN